MQRSTENCLILCIVLALQAQTNYGVTINMDTSQAPQLANYATRLKLVLEQWFPRVNKWLSSPNYTPPKNFLVTFDPKYEGVAAAWVQNRKVVGSVDFYMNSQNEYGSMIHEMAHIIQAYRNCPSWLVEGIADWIRYYKYEPSRMMPSKQRSSDSYTMGYGTSAYFLQYIIDNTPQWREPNHLVYWANKDCREGTYNYSMWKRMTGKTLEQLWADMTRSNVVVPANVPEYGCYKGYCWSWCKQQDSGNWCYTTRGQKDDKGWVKCSSPGDCNVNWDCANECHPPDYTK